MTFDNNVKKNSKKKSSHRH